MIEYLAMRIDEGALNYDVVVQKIGKKKKLLLDKALIERKREDLVKEEVEGLQK